jgi:hypothetical protein
MPCAEVDLVADGSPAPPGTRFEDGVSDAEWTPLAGGNWLNRGLALELDEETSMD